MDNSSSMKSWNILCWNIRGINAVEKWESLRDKITESNCDIISIQETKRESFDLNYIKNFCPSSFDEFCFLPSVGNSGGILVAWKSSVFHGSEIFQNNFAISVELCSALNNDSWILTSVYGPCTAEGKIAFISWFESIQMPDDMEWVIIGDFNLYRRPDNRNKPGGNLGDMMMFNGAISTLGLVEIPLVGRKFTWTNKQQHPLLERLDWFFTSQVWVSKYPNTSAHSQNILTPVHTLLSWRSLIIGPVLLKLSLLFLKEISSGSRITGCNMMGFLILWPKSGTILILRMTLRRS
jgi:hypothetical protein